MSFENVVSLDNFIKPATTALIEQETEKKTKPVESCMKTNMIFF